MIALIIGLPPQLSRKPETSIDFKPARAGFLRCLKGHAMGADRSQWQFPKNEADKLLGWRSNGKGLENKTVADLVSGVIDQLGIVAVGDHEADTFIRRNSTNDGYEALTGPEVVTALNVKALNAADGFTFNTTALPNQPYLLSEVQGSNTRTVHDFASTQTVANNGPKTTMAVTRKVTGGGAEGPPFRDMALSVVAAKDDLDSAALGEIDALFVNVYSNGYNDAGAILVGAYKSVGNGTTDEGALTTSELSTRRFTGSDPNDAGAVVNQTQQVIGFSFNPGGLYGTRAISAYWAESRVGANYAAFHGVNSLAGAGSFDYLLLGEQSRATNRYWELTFDGGAVARNFEATAFAGPTWVLDRQSGSPAANDIMGEMYFRGRNSAAEETDYVRLYSVIDDATDGSEDGSLTIAPLLSGTETRQMRIGAGVSIGPAVANLGSGSLNVQSSVATGGTIRIDANGGYRFPSFAGPAISDAANAVNTANKVEGKAIWDSTNDRVLVATGSAATDPWNIPDGTLAVTPA